MCFCSNWKREISTKSEPLTVNDLVIQPVPTGDTYTYLRIDENIASDGPLNKAKLTKEYLNCIKKIWSSELSDYNSCSA